MDQKIRKQWTAALRSGEYGQAKEVLRVQDNYCCLGVLCDLHAKVTNPPENDGWVQKLSNTYTYGLESEETVLPTEVQTWSKLMTGNPSFQASDKPYNELYAGDIGKFQRNEILSLAELNDEGLTFSQIADVIDYMFKE